MLIQHHIRYDTRCYFNVRSKANMSQLNLPHGDLADIIQEVGNARYQVHLVPPKVTTKPR